MSRLIIPGSETLEPAGSQLACVAGGISCASAFVLKGLVKSLVAASPLANSLRALPAHESRQLRRLVHRCRSYPSFCSIKRLGVFPLPLDGMLVHRRALSCNLFGFPSYHEGPPGRARTQTARSGDTPTSHGATAPLS